MAKRTVFLAIPSWSKCEEMPISSITHTALMWSLPMGVNILHEGGCTLIECNVRGERRELRRRIEWVYEVPTSTVVR